MGVYGALADLVSYPRPDVIERVDACLAELERQPTAGPMAAASLLAFRAEAARIGPARLEEVYAAAFDFDPACTLSVGHHVFGETARRSYFMCRLAEMYRAAGLPAVAADLPDHLPAILRYLDARPEGREIDELVADAVVPAIGRVAEVLERASHPYAPVVRALLACLSPAVADTRAEGAPV